MTLCDASALIALINSNDVNHQRCVDCLPTLDSPLITTWSCFTEAMHLLGSYGGWPAQEELWGYVTDGIVIIHFNTVAEQEEMQALMERYRDLPMDLADASLVATANALERDLVFTLDRDFYVYRRSNNQPFQVVPGF